LGEDEIMDWFEFINSTGISKVQDAYDPYFLFFLILAFLGLFGYLVWTNIKLERR
jgi:hypothetical protein